MSEMRVVFLGTSSGKPTLSRGLSAVAVVLDGQLVLFDCGEGTQVQFMRAGLRPSRLVLTCVSHFHGDHINGLPGFLSTMALDQHDRAVALVGPQGMSAYLRCLRRLNIFVPRFRLNVHEIERAGEVYNNAKFRVLAREVEHRIQTWGFRFEEHDKPGRFDLESAVELGVPKGPLFGQLQNGSAVSLEDGSVVQPSQVLGPTRPGRKVAYVTDTRPSDAAVELADGVDLLIHEGTYGPGLEKQARERGHCTVVDAAKVAVAACVKRLIITHISPKHDDVRPLLAAAREVFPNTTIATDLLSVTV